MLNSRFKAALVALAASASLAACTNLGPYGGVGVGVGSGYGNYGYGSQYGYGYGPYNYGSPYYNAYYGGYPYFGWYDGFYYPGSGYWVYDRDGHHHPISEQQKSYWSGMLQKFREKRGAEAAVQQNFSAFRTQAKAGATIAGVNVNAQADPASVRQINQARRQAKAEQQQQLRSKRQQARAERQEARSESSSDSMRERIRERRARRGGGE